MAERAAALQGLCAQTPSAIAPVRSSRSTVKSMSPAGRSDGALANISLDNGKKLKITPDLLRVQTRSIERKQRQEVATRATHAALELTMSSNLMESIGF